MSLPSTAALNRIYAVCMLLMKQAKMITDCQDSHFHEMSLRHYHYLPETEQRKMLSFHASMSMKAPTIHQLVEIHKNSFNDLHSGIEFLDRPMVENIATYVMHDIQLQIQNCSSAYTRLITIQRLLLKLLSGVYDWLFKLSVSSTPKNYLIAGLQTHVSSLLYSNKFTRNSDLHNTHIELHYKELLDLVNALDEDFAVPSSHSPILLYLGECAALFEKQLEAKTCQAVFHYTPGTTALLRDHYMIYTFLKARPTRFLIFNRGYRVQVVDQAIRQCYQHYEAAWCKNAESFQAMCQSLNFVFHFFLKVNSTLHQHAENGTHQDHFTKITSLIQSGLSQLKLSSETRERLGGMLAQGLPCQYKPSLDNIA